MSFRNSRAAGREYISYGDVLDWQQDFTRTHRVLVDWKLTLRREQDGGLGCYVTLFVKKRQSDGGGLRYTEVVRFGSGQDATTLPAGMIRALILADRALNPGGVDQEEGEENNDPARPLL